MELAEQERLQTTDVQSDVGPPNLESFSTVAVGKEGYEAAVLMHSIRQYSDKPIFLFADEAALNLLVKRLPSGVEVTEVPSEVLKERRKEFPENLSEVWRKGKELSSLFPPEILSLKMDAMLKAIKRTGNTLFVDADIVFTGPISCNFTTPLVLSPHFEDVTSIGGEYNAGYVYSSSDEFPYYWKQKFEDDSSFFEQECMTRFPFNFDTRTFSKSHNVGLWRTRHLDPRRSPQMHMKELGIESFSDVTIDGEKLVSFHLHLRPRLLQRDPSYNIVNVFYESMKRSANEKHKELLRFINNEYIPDAFMYGLGED
jgi:hypothetical protein